MDPKISTLSVRAQDALARYKTAENDFLNADRGKRQALATYDRAAHDLAITLLVEQEVASALDS